MCSLYAMQQTKKYGVANNEQADFEYEIKNRRSRLSNDIPDRQWRRWWRRRGKRKFSRLEQYAYRARCFQYRQCQYSRHLRHPRTGQAGLRQQLQRLRPLRGRPSQTGQYGKCTGTEFEHQSRFRGTPPCFKRISRS